MPQIILFKDGDVAAEHLLQYQAISVQFKSIKHKCQCLSNSNSLYPY